MKHDLHDVIKKHTATGGFIKTSDAPLTALTSEQKAQLNRRGNMLFNEGDIQAARRLFITTGYSDGLSRVGDVSKKEGKDLDALKLYHLAHNTHKVEPIAQKIASVISALLQDTESPE